MDADWVSYFEQNRARRQRLDWGQGVAVPPHLQRVLLRSLQRFEVGERGAGRHLHAAARVLGNERYTAAIALFIQEEQAHARHLAAAIVALGGVPLPGHWTDACFVRLRRLAGLRTELLVLLTAELIGLHYYRALRDSIPEPRLRALFAELVRDEEAHLAFHTDALHWLLAGLPRGERALVLVAWRAFCGVVGLVVVIDHRSLLAGIGWSGSAFLTACAELRAQAEQRIRKGASMSSALPGAGSGVDNSGDLRAFAPADFRGRESASHVGGLGPGDATGAGAGRGYVFVPREPV